MTLADIGILFRPFGVLYMTLADYKGILFRPFSVLYMTLADYRYPV